VRYHLEGKAGVVGPFRQVRIALRQPEIARARSKLGH